MTLRPKIEHFLQDRSGASAAEFALVFLMFVTLIFGIIDFSRALWQWNMAEKATQMGVRVAVVSDLVPETLQTWDAVAAGYTLGDPVPIVGIAPNPIVCTVGSCTGGWGYDSVAFNRIVTRMSQLYPQMQANNVTIEYRHVGLGIAGNPIGPHIDPLVTVKLANLSFQFLTPGLAGLVTMDMPEFTSTLSAEDSSDTPPAP
jgi:Flp pilus assembly protein TadG